MNRKEFFKKLGIGVVAIVAAPKVLTSEIPVNPIRKTGFPKITTAGELDPGAFRKYPMTYRECYSPEDIIRIRKQTGDLIYQMRPYQESLQQSWMKLYEALEKAKP